MTLLPITLHICSVPDIYPKLSWGMKYQNTIFSFKKNTLKLCECYKLIQ